MTDQWMTRDTRRMRILGYGTLLLLLVVFVVWGTVARLNGAVIASGALEVASYRQIVQHSDGGTIKELLVQNGAKVQAGDVVMRLDDNLLRPEYEIYDTNYIEALAEKGRLIAERDQLAVPIFPDALIQLSEERQDARASMDAQHGLFEFRRNAIKRETELIDDRVAQIDKRIEGANAELTASKEQKKYIEDELKSRERLLDKGLADRAQVTALRRDLASIQGVIGKIEASIAALRDEYSSMEIERLKLRAKPREEAIARLRELESREVELFQRRATLATRIKELEIRAPISGTVYGMNVYTPETVIQSAQPLLFIIPGNDEMIVRAQLPGGNINDIFVGQEAELRFSAYNQRQIPYISGQLRNISADAYVDENTGFRYYEIEVHPEAGINDKLGDEILIPGQPVEVFLHTGSRTFLDYLIRPLKDNFARAFRED